MAAPSPDIPAEFLRDPLIMDQLASRAREYGDYDTATMITAQRSLGQIAASNAIEAPKIPRELGAEDVDGFIASQADGFSELGQSLKLARTRVSLLFLGMYAHRTQQPATKPQGIANTFAKLSETTVQNLDSMLSDESINLRMRRDAGVIGLIGLSAIEAVQRWKKVN